MMKQIIKYMPTRFLQLFGFLLLSGLLTAPAMAAAQIMTAPEAQEAVKEGKMILLDIRTPEEWREDGVAEGAYPVDLSAKNFGELLNKVLEQRDDKLLGMICATGGRTGYVMSVLAQNKLTGIVDVSEGMHGRFFGGPGWLKRGLPVITADEAQKAFDERFNK
uniref:Rhodanese domain-containing protein n=1 Tax=uncultured Thiotrichaceae bacterium TaxID=298394 RepID=A0A6S6STC3_9GAMM|nr:MAG: Unknown protein [uncultured Thiotrichaceae bacterium]